MTENEDITAAIGGYYTEKIRQFGATPQGVDWRNQESQENRFRQLHRLFEDQPFSTVLDLGCGYGSMLAFLRARHFVGKYIGIDISPEMIEKAVELFKSDRNASFKQHREGTALQTTADFVVASGIFNVRLEFDNERWLSYLKNTLHQMDQAACAGFAFNCLTSYSDAPLMRDYLFYANPCRLFDYCKRNFSRQVALLHDYGLYEFTIIVRKD
jgi:SAM-dependent methyltransferase